MAHNRAVCTFWIYPGGIIPGNEFEKFSIGFTLLALQYFLHFRAITFFHFQFPIHQFFVNIHPLIIIRIAVQRHKQIAELLLVGSCCFFRNQSFIINYFF